MNYHIIDLKMDVPFIERLPRKPKLPLGKRIKVIKRGGFTYSWYATKVFKVSVLGLVEYYKLP